MRVNLSFDLPDELDTELKSAASTSGISTAKWSAMVIEAALATRRLDSIEPATRGAQFVTER